MAVSSSAAGVSTYNGAGVTNNYQSYAHILQQGQKNVNQLNQPFPGYYPTSHVGIIPPKRINYDNSLNSIKDTDNPLIFTKDNKYNGGYNQGIFGKADQYKPEQFKPSPHLFNKNAFKNVLVGMLMWHFVSGFGNKYTIYNYYSQPKTTTENNENLSKDMLVACDVYSTILCGPDIQPICTKNETIFCLADKSQVFRCNHDTTLNCVNTTVFCLYENDPLCKNSSDPHEARVTVPCLGNISSDTDVMNTKNKLETPINGEARAGKSNLETPNFREREVLTNIQKIPRKGKKTPKAVTNVEYTYCVTLKAVADPKYKVDGQKVDGHQQNIN